MKRKITTSIALVLSIFLALLTSSDLTAQAQQQQQKYVADTGFIALGPNQELRIMVSPIGELGPITTYLRFTRMTYSQEACSGGICKHSISSQTTTPPMVLAWNEVVELHMTPMPNSSGVRAIVETNRRDARVNAQIFNVATGDVDCSFTLPVN